MRLLSVLLTGMILLSCSKSSSSKKSLMACDISDISSSGWDITKVSSVTGNKSGVNTDQCEASCISNYKVDTDQKKCVVDLDPDGDGIVEETALKLLLGDAETGYISSVVELDPTLIYEIHNELTIPDGITLKGPDSGARAVIRKRPAPTILVDHAFAQNIKDLVIANFPQITFDGSGNVTQFNGSGSVSSLNAAMTALTEFYEDNLLLDPLVVTFDDEKFRFDLNSYGRRCWNAANESSTCPSGAGTGITKFTPFFQEILNTPNSDLVPIDRTSAKPILLVERNNVSLENLDISCVEDTPYFPVHEMENPDVSHPNGLPVVVGGIRTPAGFTANGIYLKGAQNAVIRNVQIQNCSLGIYSINSKNVEISDNTILTDVKPLSLHPLTELASGDVGVKWNRRFHGINAIRIHGTQDKNFLIKNNTIGSISSGAQKGIHIHGTSASGRDDDLDGLADSPDNGFLTEDEGLESLAKFVDRSNPDRVMRKNFKILNNTITGQHISGIDIEGDQMNIDIRDNVIRFIRDQFYQRTAITSQDSGVGIRVLSEASPLDIFNFYGGSSTPYSLDFVGFVKNIQIQNNTIEDSYVGIGIFGMQNNSAVAYDDFPLVPLSPVNSNYNCSLSSMNSSCTSQMSLSGNTIRRMVSNPNTTSPAQLATLALQSYCIVVTNAVGIEIVDNILDTCNVPRFDFNGNATAMRLISSKKVHFRNNIITIDTDAQNERLALGSSASFVGSNRYYGLTSASTAANPSTVSRLVDSEFLIDGYTSPAAVTTFNFKTVGGGRLGDANLSNENPVTPPNDPLDPYRFISSLELDALSE